MHYIYRYPPQKLTNVRDVKAAGKTQQQTDNNNTAIKVTQFTSCTLCLHLLVPTHFFTTKALVTTYQEISK